MQSDLKSGVSRTQTSPTLTTHIHPLRKCLTFYEAYPNHNTVRITCGECEEECSIPFHHCDVCVSFDLCQRCFTQSGSKQAGLKDAWAIKQQQPISTAQGSPTSKSILLGGVASYRYRTTTGEDERVEDLKAFKDTYVNQVAANLRLAFARASVSDSTPCFDDCLSPVAEVKQAPIAQPVRTASNRYDNQQQDGEPEEDHQRPQSAAPSGNRQRSKSAVIGQRPHSALAKRPSAAKLPAAPQQQGKQKGVGQAIVLDGAKGVHAALSARSPSPAMLQKTTATDNNKAAKKVGAPPPPRPSSAMSVRSAPGGGGEKQKRPQTPTGGGGGKKRPDSPGGGGLDLHLQLPPSGSVSSSGSGGGGSKKRSSSEARKYTAKMRFLTPRRLGAEHNQTLAPWLNDVEPVPRSAEEEHALKALQALESLDPKAWSGVKRAWASPRVPTSAADNGQQQQQAAIAALGHSVPPVARRTNHLGLVDESTQWDLAGAPPPASAHTRSSSDRGSAGALPPRPVSVAERTHQQQQQQQGRTRSLSNLETPRGSMSITGWN